MINSLQSLRGLFAIMIFLSHFSISDTQRVFYAGGTMGVEYFIVLSGFVLCAGYERIIDAKKIDYKNFMLRRLIRIYPLHIFCLVAYYIVYNLVPFDINIALPNFFLIQAWIPDEYVYYGCNTPSWCLSVFVFLYACYPVIILYYNRSPRLMVRLFCAAWALYLVYLLALPSDLTSNLEIWLTRVLPPIRLLDFTLGILLWHLYKKIDSHGLVLTIRNKSVIVKTVIEFLPILFYAIVSIAFYHLKDRWCSEAIWWIPTVACLMIYSIFNKGGGLISRILNHKWLVAFGNASFCFYLLHLLVIQGCYRSGKHFGLEMRPFAMLFITLALAIAISMIVSRYIDNPVGRFLKKKLLRKK